MAMVISEVSALSLRDGHPKSTVLASAPRRFVRTRKERRAALK
jgi:hypothetical protein